MADCPGVTTHETCGEEPHSDRSGKGLTFGVSYRAGSAQDCCDKCKAHAKGCNSWTFCGVPVALHSPLMTSDDLLIASDCL
jgi:hypothetical protein